MLRVRMSQRRNKNITLLWFLAIVFGEGFVDYIIIIGEGSDAYRLYSLFCLILNLLFIMRWFLLDAQEHNFRISKALFITFVAVTFIAAPYYFIKTRGKRGFLSILLAVLFFLPLGVSFALGQWAAEVSHLRSVVHGTK